VEQAQAHGIINFSPWAMTCVLIRLKEHLAEKYPSQDMSIVAESFEIKLTRAISEKPALAQNHSRGVRI
jgi:hypothetical protein